MRKGVANGRSSSRAQAKRSRLGARPAGEGLHPALDCERIALRRRRIASLTLGMTRLALPRKGDRGDLVQRIAELAVELDCRVLRVDDRGLVVFGLGALRVDAEAVVMQQ